MNAVEHRAALLRYLRRRLSDSHTAEDLAQEAFVRLLAKPRTVTHSQAYLFQIASNLVYELRGRERRAVVCFDSRITEAMAERVHGHTSEPGETLDRRKLLETMLGRLPPLYAKILVMKKRDGLSLEEIALTLGISIHTAKKYLFLAVTRCRASRRARP